MMRKIKAVLFCINSAQGAVKIYDIDGREIKTLVDARQSAGERRVFSEAINLPSALN